MKEAVNQVREAVNQVRKAAKQVREAANLVRDCAFWPFRIFFDFLNAFMNLNQVEFLKMCPGLDDAFDASFGKRSCCFSSFWTFCSTL